MKAIDIEKISIDNNILNVNDNFICKPLHEKYTLTTWEKENNCNRISRYIEVDIFDYVHFRRSSGKIKEHIDKDLNLLSFVLEKNDVFDGLSLITITDCKISHEFVRVDDIVKQLTIKPLYKMKDPFESHGLSILDFKKIHNKNASIEYSDTGNLYYEVLDLTDYEDADFIPFDSSRRSDVINISLTYDNLNLVMSKINNSLEKLYKETKND